MIALPAETARLIESMFKRMQEGVAIPDEEFVALGLERQSLWGTTPPPGAKLLTPPSPRPAPMPPPPLVRRVARRPIKRPAEWEPERIRRGFGAAPPPPLLPVAPPSPPQPPEPHVWADVRLPHGNPLPTFSLVDRPAWERPPHRNTSPYWERSPNNSLWGTGRLSPPPPRSGNCPCERERDGDSGFFGAPVTYRRRCPCKTINGDAGMFGPGSGVPGSFMTCPCHSRSLDGDSGFFH